MIETNRPSCNLETEFRIVQFRSFGFWSFDIVSVFSFGEGDNFGFRDSNFYAL